MRAFDKPTVTAFSFCSCLRKEALGVRGRRGGRKGPYQEEEEREGRGISGGTDSDRSDLSTTLTHDDLVGRVGQAFLGSLLDVIFILTF